ncbi:MAG TPA: BrnT family toxin [Pyrinomonadaceae bacterium]|nr:BrnT family toxin [Pyrinomonadaceae bacterium]
MNEYLLNDVRFEWDTKKASANLKKYSVSFESACEVFFNPFLKVIEVEFTDDEQRETVIGLNFEWKALYVVYVMREESIRLISARPTTKSERNDYENQ